MNRTSWILCLTALLIVFSWAGRGISQTQEDAGIFVDAQSPPTASIATPVQVLRQRYVTVNFDRIRATMTQGTGSSQTLLLNLFPDTRFVAVLDRVEQTATGYVWVGRLQGVGASSVTLAVNANVVAARIVTVEAAYAVRYAAAGVHIVQELNRQAFPPEAPPLTVPNPGPPRDNQPRAASDDDGSMIDILVVYTPAARNAQGGTSAIEALIDLGI